MTNEPSVITDFARRTNALPLFMDGVFHSFWPDFTSWQFVNYLTHSDEDRDKLVRDKLVRDIHTFVHGVGSPYELHSTLVPQSESLQAIMNTFIPVIHKERLTKDVVDKYNALPIRPNVAQIKAVITNAASNYLCAGMLVSELQQCIPIDRIPNFSAIGQIVQSQLVTTGADQGRLLNAYQDFLNCLYVLSAAYIQNTERAWTILTHNVCDEPYRVYGTLQEIMGETTENGNNYCFITQYMNHAASHKKRLQTSLDRLRISYEPLKPHIEHETVVTDYSVQSYTPPRSTLAFIDATPGDNADTLKNVLPVLNDSQLSHNEHETVLGLLRDMFVRYDVDYGPYAKAAEPQHPLLVETKSSRG